MSNPIIVQDNSDMPCEDWKGTPAEKKDCPMQEEWHEGENRMCGECGWEIEYRANDELTNL